MFEKFSFEYLPHPQCISFTAQGINMDNRHSPSNFAPEVIRLEVIHW